MKRSLRRVLVLALLATAAYALRRHLARRALLARLSAELPGALLSGPATEWRRDPDGTWRAVEGALALAATRLLFIAEDGPSGAIRAMRASDIAGAKGAPCGIAQAADDSGAIPRADVKRAEFIYGLPGRGFPAGLLSLHLPGGDRHFRLPGDAHPWLDLLNRS